MTTSWISTDFSENSFKLILDNNEITLYEDMGDMDIDEIIITVDFENKILSIKPKDRPDKFYRGIGLSQNENYYFQRRDDSPYPLELNPGNFKVLKDQIYSFNINDDTSLNYINDPNSISSPSNNNQEIHDENQVPIYISSSDSSAEEPIYSSSSSSSGSSGSGSSSDSSPPWDFVESQSHDESSSSEYENYNFEEGEISNNDESSYSSVTSSSSSSSSSSSPPDPTEIYKNYNEISSNEIKELVKLHIEYCYEKSTSELKNLIEPWKIRSFFPNYNFEKTIGEEYAKNVFEMCDLLTAALFCNDIELIFENRPFDEMKKFVAKNLFPDAFDKIMQSKSKQELCREIGENMDKSYKSKNIVTKLDPRLLYCENIDYINRLEWSEYTPEELDDEIIIKIWFDPSNNRKADCFIKYTLIEMWKTPGTIMADWVPKNQIMEDEGYGGMAGSERFYRLPDGKYIDRHSYKIIKNLTSNGDFDAAIVQANKRIGNTRSSFGMSETHGQIGSAQNIYRLSPRRLLTRKRKK